MSLETSVKVSSKLVTSLKNMIRLSNIRNDWWEEWDPWTQYQIAIYVSIFKTICLQPINKSVRDPKDSNSLEL